MSSQPSSLQSGSTRLHSAVRRLPQVVRGRLGDLKYTLRVALAVGVLLGWTLQAQPYSWQYWNASVQTPQAPGESEAARRAFLEGEGAVGARVEKMGGTPQQGANLYMLLEKAQASCPVDSPVLILGDYLLVGQSAYVLYPRRVDVKPITEPLERLDMAKGAGGCLILFGGQGGGALPSNLTAVACNGDGCLYSLADD